MSELFALRPDVIVEVRIFSSQPGSPASGDFYPQISRKCPPMERTRVTSIFRISLEPFHCRQWLSSISKNSLRFVGAKDDMEVARRCRQSVRPLRRIRGLFMLDGDRERTV